MADLGDVSATSLTVSGATALSGTLQVGSDTTLAGDLTVQGGDFTLGNTSAAGTRTLSLEKATTGKIQFSSGASGSTDKGFLLYKSDSSFLNSVDSTTGNKSRLSVGVFGQFGTFYAGSAESVDVQGGYQLTLNAGYWDSELDSEIGTPGWGEMASGISLRYGNSEKMKVGSSGVTISSATSLSSSLSVTGSATLSGGLSVPSGATTLGGGLSVTSGSTTLGGGLSVTSGSTTLSGSLAVGTNASVTGDLTVTGGDITVGSSSSVANRSLTFERSAQATVLFHSNANYGSDKGFILWQDDSDIFGSTSVADTENGRLSIGVHNDSSGSAADTLDLQGGYQLTLNAGAWDAELNSKIGTLSGGTPYGLSLRVNNSEIMKVASTGVTVNSGLTVASGQAVSGVSVVELKSTTFSIDSTGGTHTCPNQTISFSREITSAIAVISSWDLNYDSRLLLKRGAVRPSVSWSGNVATVSLNVIWEDDNYDDDYTGTVIIGVIATLKYAP